MRRSVVAISVLALVAGGSGLAACGGSNSTNGGGGDAGEDATGDALGVDSTTEGGGPDSAGDVANNSDGTGGDTGNAGDAGDAGNPGDAAPDAPSDALAMPDVMLVTDAGGPLNDASPGGDGAALNCGAEICNLPVQACCLYPIVSPPPAFYAACSTGGTCPPTLPPDAGYEAGAPTQLGCEVQSNCTGATVCCLESDTSGHIGSHCRSTGSCVGSDAGPDASGSAVALLCDPSLGGDAGCGGAGACSGANISTWRLPNGFGTCGGIAR